MTLNINEMRQNMQVQKADKARNGLFLGLGAAVIAAGAAGGLAWALLDVGKPLPSATTSASALAPEVVTAGTGLKSGFDTVQPGGAEDVSGEFAQRMAAFKGPSIDEQHPMVIASRQIAQLQRTLNNISACSKHWSAQTTKAQLDLYERRNKAAYEHWAAYTDKAWNYNPTTKQDVMVGAMTGQIQDAAIGRMMGFEAMMAGSDEKLTAQDCARLRKAIEQGERDLRAPPAK